VSISPLIQHIMSPNSTTWKMVWPCVCRVYNRILRRELHRILPVCKQRYVQSQEWKVSLPAWLEGSAMWSRFNNIIPFVLLFQLQPGR